MTRPLRLLLLMHSTRSHNLGVGALSVAQVAILRDIAADLGRQVEITLVDFKDARAPYIEGDDIRIVPLSGKWVKSPSGYWAELRKTDVVIDIGGGDSFADIYGTKRLRMMFALKALAHLAGKPFVFAPQTVGPFTKASSRIAARIHLNRCALVAVRDEPSRDHMAELGVSRPPILASDVALRMPPGPRPTFRGDGPRVGLNVSGLLMAGGYSGGNDFGLGLDYPRLIRDLIAFFQAEGAEVHLIPHVIVPEGPMVGEDDYAACAALVAGHPGTVLAPAFASPPEAKGYIAAMDFFLGARMHACIAAFSTDVPVVPMAYSRKFAGLFGSLGYGRTVDCTAEDAETILSRVQTAWRDRAAVAGEVATAYANGRERLKHYENGLRDILARA
ncbi:polysaccharide pyruvyl transferase family protein [Jannaschia pohangensis]|uniref:Polysaccharide pyruvyl transferase family protein WcaK n=1 Tax=Jannaschia pohangensis TaxID=390807 RepID=A0A1I3TTM9_9RHOB|nr:polysaccharide pyruvyl transferase family protein [Jannaschia pohangensis]SFJ73970.1 Polysaccharide pyruvyl transferase family protein WcaK [Jannaschia pohangensis]